MVKFELKRKETGTKTIAMATLNYAPCHVLYGVKCPCKVFPLHCFILSRDMLGFVF